MTPTSNNSDLNESELRENDRRQTSFRTLLGLIFTCRRRHSRRYQDEINNYIDWYGPWPLVASLLIIGMCFLDAYLTLILLNHGAEEANVLMDWLIQKDVFTFTTAKMGITSLSVIVLVMHHNFRVYKIIAVRYLMYALVPLYSLLIAHEINMLAQI
ncbi:MAG: DUF5658 family protein [Gammaproteobacteria bacterium]